MVMFLDAVVDPLKINSRGLTLSLNFMRRLFGLCPYFCKVRSYMENTQPFLLCAYMVPHIRI